MPAEEKPIRAWTCRDEFEALRLIEHLAERGISASLMPENAETVCVMPADHAEARAIIDVWDPSYVVEKKQIRCPACGEGNPADFVACWSCTAQLDPSLEVDPATPREVSAAPLSVSLETEAAAAAGATDSQATGSRSSRKVVLWINVIFFLFAAMAGMRFKLYSNWFGGMDFTPNPNAAIADSTNDDLDLVWYVPGALKEDELFRQSPERQEALENAIALNYWLDDSERDPFDFFGGPFRPSKDSLAHRAHQAVLHAENQNWKKLRPFMVREKLDLELGFLDTLSVAYPALGYDRPAEPVFDLGPLSRADSQSLREGWVVDRLEARWAASIGDSMRALNAENRICDRGQRLHGETLRRSRVLWISFALALVLFLLWAVRGFPGTSDSEPFAWSCWSPIRAYVVFASSVVISALLGASSFFGLLRTYPVLNRFIFMVYGLLAIVLLRQFVLKPNKQTLTGAFRFLPHGTWALSLGVVVAILGFDLFGNRLAYLISDSLQLGIPVLEPWVSEHAVIDTTFVARQFFLTVVCAPLVEEILYRGFLYGTLRHHFSPFQAAMISAWLFSAFHPYTATEFLSIFFFGILTAFAYEKTRSLFPCIVAHALYNLYVTVDAFVWAQPSLS